MPDYSLVPADYQPDFGDYSLVPVDHDPFAAHDVAQQRQIQYAQAEPQGPPQQQPATGAGQPDAGAPAAAPADPLTSNGVLTALHDENNMFDSYVYKKLSTGTPPAGPQVTVANSNRKITATDNAGPTNFGGVYGHALTYSEPGSNDLATITAADPTGLLVATPVEGDPSRVSIREYKGY
jgi:hypothetical protein